jgi:hypothetical protein
MEVVLSTDEGRGDRPSERRHVVEQIEHAEGLHRLALALQLERLGRLRADLIADQPLRGRADQDLVRVGGLLQPRGDVYRVPGDQRLARAGDHLAGVHADADLQSEHADGLPHLDRGAYRPERVILVDLRQAEDRHRGVAHELLDGSPVALEDRAELAVVTRHELTKHLGIGPLAECRRADEIAEHDGDGLADARRRLHVERCAAGGAEPGVLQVLPAARWAGHHPRRVPLRDLRMQDPAAGVQVNIGSRSRPNETYSTAPL